MNAITTKQQKSFNDHLYSVKFDELTKLIPLVKEQQVILAKENCSTLVEFEFKLNEKTGFVNANLASQALGKEAEYQRLKEIELKLNEELSVDDLTKDYKFKLNFLNKLQEEFTVYFTEEELELKTTLESIMKQYNSLPMHHRQLAINREGLLTFNLFNTIIR